jgi:polar amino acid transport system ATP-binding protein
MLEIKNATKKYPSKDFRGINDVSFSVTSGEIICILGQSGSGKSTLLRVLANLEKLDKGSVVIEQKTLASYVSQDYTLWPHLTVLKNLTLAPKLNSSTSETEIIDEAMRLLNRFGLGDYAESYPAQLSGGQRQRVALLRAVMMKPQILLLDEITSALDPELTKGVLDLIRALAKDGYTMIVVTHHMSFAMSLADRILFLKNGSVLQDKDAIEFFSAQSDPEIKSFILDIAKRDESIEVFKGLEQFQAYHYGLIKRLPESSTMYVAGAVGDTWYDRMGEFYPTYESLRIKRKIIWKMVTYDQGETDRRLAREHPKLNQFRSMPRNIQNPANYIVVGDTVITQIFENEPTIIQVKNQFIADAYMRFFEELWEAGIMDADRFDNILGDQYNLFKKAIPHHDEFQDKLGQVIKKYSATLKDAVLSAIDGGCGTGLTTVRILEADKRIKVIGIDSEEKTIDQAHEILKEYENRVTLQTADLLEALKKIPSESVDIFASVWVIHNLTPKYRKDLFAEITRVLKKGGLFINGDKYARNDSTAHTQDLEAQIRAFDAFDEMKRPDLKKEWTEHYRKDDKIKITEQAQNKILKDLGFKKIENQYRQGLEAIITAIR